MSTRFAIETVFRSVDQTTGTLKRMTASVSRFANVTEKSLGRVNKSLTRAHDATQKAVRGTAVAAAATAAGMTKVVTVGADFEQQIVNAAAKFPGAIRQGSAAFESLSDAARKTGAQTEFSATQAASALDFLAMAGFNADAAVAALPKVVDLATAANLDLASASDIASDALGQFDMNSTDVVQQTKNLDRIMDVMSKTATSANVTVAQLFESFKDAGPVGTAAGASIETVSTLAATLANAGLKGSRSGTALRAVFGRLQAPVGDAAKVLRRMGIETRDASGNMLDVVDVLGQIDKAMTGLGTAEKASILKTVFGEEPIAAVNVLMKAGTQNLKDYRKGLENASGSTAEMAKVMRNTTRNDIKGTMSAIEGLTVSFFNMNKDGVREGVQGLTEWVRQLDATLKSNESLAKSLGGDIFDGVVNAAKAIGVLVGAMIALKAITMLTSAAMFTYNVVTKAVTAGIWLWNTAAVVVGATMKALRIAVLALNIAMYANPIGVLIGAVVALGAAAYVLVTKWDVVKEFFVGLWDGITSAFSTAIDAITAVASPFLDLVGNITSIWEKLTGTVSKPIDAKMTLSAEQQGEDTAPASPRARRARSAQTAGAAVASPQESISRSVAEGIGRADVTIRNDVPGTTAAATSTNGPGLNVINSGGFYR